MYYMKRLTVLIDSSAADNAAVQSKELELDESFIITHEDPYLLVKKAAVFLNYNNITSDLEITYNNIKKTIKEGHWTFSMLKKEIESYGTVTLEANKYYGTCNITSDNTINLKNLGPILGFDKNQVINTNTKTVSGKQVNINNGLEYIEVSRSLVNMSENINSDGQKSDVIITLPITSTQTLKGSVQHYTDIESRVQIDNGVINKVNFKVSKYVGKVLLDLYIV